MTPRPYQAEALDALDSHLCETDEHPLVVLPTGAGKSPFMAWAIQRWAAEHPPLRVLVLAHIRELVRQNSEKMRTVWPQADIGIFSAGLGRKDRRRRITFANVQSIYRHVRDLAPFDVVFIDEAHRIPASAETMYRQLIHDAKTASNHRVRFVGVTATPYRLDGGLIYGPDQLFRRVTYSAGVKDLIGAGYLCQLRSKGGEAEIDTRGVHIRQGEFVTDEIESRAMADGMVAGAVREMIARMTGRRTVLVFCVTIDHAEAVAAELARSGELAHVVSMRTPTDERDAIVSQFSSGRIRWVCNVNVLSEGFDAQRIDGIVMLRPTTSPGLYYQQVGRGLRIHPDKADCLVLDFAGNVRRHGPIDEIRAKRKSKDPGEGEAPVKKCPACAELIAPASAICPCCGHEFPPRKIEHQTRPDETPILSTSEPWWIDVTDVTIRRHQKAGSRPTLEVTYIAGLSSVREWICLEHFGYAREKAVGWWRRRFGEPVPETVDVAMADLFLTARIRAVTRRVKVRREGKYESVIGYDLSPIAHTHAATMEAIAQ
jgi:DNA repair protein RadD